MKISRKAFMRTLAGMAAAGMGPRHAGSETTPQGLVEKKLGKTGLAVTALGMGAARTMEPALVTAALDRGIRFIDTGRSYFNGKNEEMLGEALKGRRGRAVIQSKTRLPPNFVEKPGGELASRLEADLDLSLKALQTDWLDVMLIHGVEAEQVLDHEGVREFFTRAKKAGKIRACGFSTHRNHLALLEKAVQTGFFDVVMLPFNPFGRFTHSQGGWKTDWDQAGLIKVMEKAHQAGLGIVAMKTCSGGPFAFRQGDPPSLAAAVRWVTEKPYVDSTAVAMANFAQLDDHCPRAGQ